MSILATPTSITAIEKGIKPRITVIGVGGAGSNAVDNMIRSHLEGVEFIQCNTDGQALEKGLAATRLQLGMKVTQGLGAGSKPEVGQAAAQESIEEVLSYLRGTHMLFITAGMGGGTGTGGAPIIARSAKDLGILTVGVVTKPFHFEGKRRMQTAESGIEEMYRCVDTLLIIPNQNLFRVANEKTTFGDAFAMADNVLLSGVRTFTDLMIQHGLINLDFADICVVMREMSGKAMMGTGQSVGEKRATEAAEMAISCPLLDDVSMQGARSVLINVTGGLDMTLFEVDEAANRIREEVASDANIIFGATFDESMSGQLRVSVVATGIDMQGNQQSHFAPQHSLLKEELTFDIPDLATDEEEPFQTTPDEVHLGHRHDFFALEYPNQTESSMTDLQEPESPFKTRTLSEIYAENKSTSDLDPQKISAFQERAPRKPLSFLGRLAAGVQRKPSPKPAPIPKPEYRQNDLKTQRAPTSSPAHDHKNFSNDPLKNPFHLDPGNLEIPAFLRNQGLSKKPPIQDQ